MWKDMNCRTILCKFSSNFTLQNLLFYYDTEQSVKPIGVIFLEGCFCERVLNPSTGNTSSDKLDHNRQAEKMVLHVI